jgi:hypothetical protein
MPSIISILFHVGAVIKAVKDIEKSVADCVQGKPSMADLKVILEDVAELVADGLIVIPGVSIDQIATIIKDLEQAI